MFKYPAYKYGGMVLYGQHGISDWFRSRAGTRTGVGFYTDHFYNGLKKVWDPKKGAKDDYVAAKSYLLGQGYDEDELDAYAKGEGVGFSNSRNVKDRTRALDIMKRDYAKWKGIRDTASSASNNNDNVQEINENEGIGDEEETPVEENPAPVGGNGTGGSEIGGTPGEISGPAPGQSQGEGQGGYDIDELKALFQQFHELFEQWSNSQNQSEETEEEPEEESEEEQTPALGRHDLMGLENWQLRSLRKGYGVDMGNGVTLKAANKKAGRQAARAIRRERRLDNMPFNVGTNTGTGFRYGPMTYSEE